LLLSSKKIKEEVDLKSIAIVHNFLEIFPNNIPGLPPNGEIKFSIDLMLVTGPISIAPYNLSPFQLVEPKKQLKKVN